MDFPEDHVVVISRCDGNRGPLGVANAVNSRLEEKRGCRRIEVSGARQLGKALLNILFKTRGCSVCIHANGYRVPLLMQMIACINRSNDYYCVVHGLARIEKMYRPVSFKDEKLESIIVKRFPKVIFVSEYERSRAFKSYGKRKETYVIHNGVDACYLDQLSCKTSRESPVFILAGGFERCKGADLATRLCAELVSRGLSPRLLVCGRDGKEVGGNREECMKVAAETGVDIRYAGEVLDKEELLKMHSEADFCFALSRFDTFNCAVLEGMAVGCIPVVSTDCGVFEILDNSSAVIVDMSVDGYIAKAAEEIASIWKDRNRYKAMAEKAYHIASQNTWNDVAENYWKLLSRG